jgi:hypothetical protein
MLMDDVMMWRDAERTRGARGVSRVMSANSQSRNSLQRSKPAYAGASH